jgi:hypothetical protein
MPMFSRLGPYPTDLLDRASNQPPRELFEYWGHEASLLPVELHPLLRWRMAHWRDRAWPGIKRVRDERPELIDSVLAEVREHGPLTAAEIEQDVPRSSGTWWNRTDTKLALEWLFLAGDVTAARRNPSFARLYDVPERVLPPAVLDAPTPTEADAQRELIRLAAVSLGVATEIELRDYYRLPVAGARQAVQDLVDDGVLLPVTVHGWKPQAYLHHEVRIPRRVHARTLLSPFDPVVWERNRALRLFDFHYRIGIYTPADKRVHGYYVLPFLYGDTVAARVDLKADRKAKTLLVLSAWLEEGQEAAEVASALAENLADLAGWLGLDGISAPDKGDLAPALSAALR